jgi:mRNA interferase MazF
VAFKSGTTKRKISTVSNPNPREIWLVQFPFSDLTATKVRPALVLATYKQDVIILGIFSKVPAGILPERWVLIADTYPRFNQTGLKKSSIIRADKIATVHQSVFQMRLGTLPSDQIPVVEAALKNALNI